MQTDKKRKNDMTKLDLNTRDYLENKGNAEYFGEVLQEKRTEIVGLEEQLAEAKADLQQLHSRLNTASRDMAIGRLSTEGFIELKRQIDEKESEIQIFSEAITAQRSSINVINQNLVSNKKENSHLVKAVADDLTGQFADEVVSQAGDSIKNLVHTIVVSRGTRTAFRLPEQQRAREDIYCAIGEELCKRAFPAAGGSVNFVPDFFEARKHVDNLVDQSIPDPA
jgi:predicted RNase H-like nuclease (RuvC/YqgF family)